LEPDPVETGEGSAVSRPLNPASAWSVTCSRAFSVCC